MTDSERLRQLENYLNLTTRALSIEIGMVRPQTLYDIHKGRINISKAVATKITTKFVNINKAWLLTGEGEMLKNSEKTPILAETKAEYHRGDERDLIIKELEREVQYYSELAKSRLQTIDVQMELIAGLKSKIEELNKNVKI